MEQDFAQKAEYNIGIASVTPSKQVIITNLAHLKIWNH